MTLAITETILADGGGTGDHMGGFAWGMMGMGWLSMLVVLILVVWTFTRLFGQVSAGEEPADSAARILSDRFARGEIDADEYRDQLSDLGLEVGNVNLVWPHSARLVWPH